MKRVLDVGQCSPDHGSIRRLVEGRFGAQVSQADDLPGALAQLRKSQFDLVLVNRKLDLDYSDGLQIIKQMKADPDLASIPVMLVSNYADAQAEAVAIGATLGFGKASIGNPQTDELLRPFLAE